MVCGPPPPPGVQLSMPPVVPIEPYEDLGVCRYGGPCKRLKPIKDAQKVISASTGKPLLERIPVEIICEIFSNLSSKDLKNAALCNRSLNEITTPILYKRSTLSTLKTLFMCTWSEDIPKDYAANVFLDPEKNKDVDTKLDDFLAKVPKGKYISLIKSLEVVGIDSRTWQFGHELLRRFPGISDIGFPWIACHREFQFPPQEPMDSKGTQLDSEERRVDRLITEFGETAMKNITQVSFNWSSIVTFKKILSHLPKLQELYAYIPDQDTHRPLPYMDYKRIVPTIAATVGSTLVRLDLGQPPKLVDIDDFIKPLGDRSKFPALKIFNVAQLPSTVGDENSRVERARFLYETCKASECHGQWTFPHVNLQVDILEMAELEAGEIKRLYLWLTKNIPKWDGEFLMEEVSFLNPVEVIPKFEGFLKKMETITDAVPLKIRIDSAFPPTKKNRILPIAKKFASRLVQLAVSPSQVDLTGEEGDEDLLAYTTKMSFIEWCNFLEAILPLCKNMHTFRTVSQTHGEGADIALLGKLEHHITALCRRHKLRHLDIDAASLLQPESVTGSALFDQDEPGSAPRVVIQGLAWMSTPRGSMMKPDFSNCLQNLRTLKMMNLFILREVEMVWLTNLTAKLKNLELIEIHGLVWHIGYEDGGDGGNDGDNSDGDKDEEWQDSEFDDDDEIPSMKEVSKQIGKLSLVNRLDADSSLLAWLPEDPESDSDSDREPEVGERKIRLARGRVDSDDDVKSTDSRFGSDPRFSKTINEELRVSRLKGWICKVLVETAKKTGGRCRKVIIEDLRIDADGLDPWCLDDLTSVDEEEWW